MSRAGTTAGTMSGTTAAGASVNRALHAGFVLTMAVMYVLLNLVIDILYGVIDPRVRLEG